MSRRETWVKTFFPKNFLLGLFVMCLVGSCQFLGEPVPDENCLLLEQEKAINWKQVDEFPSLPDCQLVKGSMLRRKCLFDGLSNILRKQLSASAACKQQPLDSLVVEITVKPKARPTCHLLLEAATWPDTLRMHLEQRLADSLPNMAPATKRGIPVTAVLRIPIYFTK
jgi:hypothetical protein